MFVFKQTIKVSLAFSLSGSYLGLITIEMEHQRNVKHFIRRDFFG